MTTFTVTVTGENAAEFAAYLLGEVSYRVENETPEGLDVWITTPPPSLAATCEHERLVLIEGGYEREWGWSEPEPGRFVATAYGSQSFADDGDGAYVLRCKSCLTEFPLPEGDDPWEWN